MPSVLSIQQSSQNKPFLMIRFCGKVGSSGQRLVNSSKRNNTMTQTRNDYDRAIDALIVALGNCFSTWEALHEYVNHNVAQAESSKGPEYATQIRSILGGVLPVGIDDEPFRGYLSADIRSVLYRYIERNKEDAITAEAFTYRVLHVCSKMFGYGRIPVGTWVRISNELVPIAKDFTPDVEESPKKHLLDKIRSNDTDTISLRWIEGQVTEKSFNAFGESTFCTLLFKNGSSTTALIANDSRNNTDLEKAAYKEALNDARKMYAFAARQKRYELSDESTDEDTLPYNFGCILRFL